MRDRNRFVVATIGALGVIALGMVWDGWARAHPHPHDYHSEPAATIAKPADVEQTGSSHG